MTYNEHIEIIRANILARINADIKTSASILAQRLDCSKTYAWQILKEKNFNPTLKKLYEIADKLGVTIDYLLEP